MKSLRVDTFNSLAPSINSLKMLVFLLNDC